MKKILSFNILGVGLGFLLAVAALLLVHRALSGHPYQAYWTAGIALSIFLSWLIWATTRK